MARCEDKECHDSIKPDLPVLNEIEMSESEKSLRHMAVKHVDN